ncbi:MAG: hydantoinase/oxoprolinase family protein, partial [Pseudomonadota bacterium]
AGPVHGGRLMRLLGAKALFVPRHPGALCAMGLLAADLRSDHVATRLQRAGAWDLAAMAEGFATLEAEATARLGANGVPPDRQRLTRLADMRYHGQGVELPVPFPPGAVNAAAAARATVGFHALHDRLYTFSDPSAPVEIVNLRVTAEGLTDHVAPPPLADAEAPAAPEGERLAAPEGATLSPVPCYGREALLAGHRIAGPAIIDQLDATTVVLAGQEARVERHGGLILEEVR